MEASEINGSQGSLATQTWQPTEREQATETAPGTTGLSVWDAGRVAAGIVGGAIVTSGLLRRSLPGTLLALAGADLVRQAVTGNSMVFKFLGVTDEEGDLRDKAIDVQRTSTIRRSPEELYRLWRDPATLPAIMEDFAEVMVLSDTRVHWVLMGPLKLRLRWETEVTEDRPGEVIRWRSIPGAELPNEGSIQFRAAPGNLGTEVVLRLRFVPPGGMLAQRAARMMRAVPRGLELRALRNFKCLAETGEVTSIKRQPACRGAGRDE